MTFLACLVLILGVLYTYFDNQLIEGLHTEGTMIAEGVEAGGAAYLDGLGALENRLTWIAPDGAVLYDSQADPSAMENHLNREEIAEALETDGGVGAVLRDALPKDDLLRPQAHGRQRDPYRGHPLYGVEPAFGMLQPLLLILTIAIVLSAILASRISRSIVKPINAINLEAPDVEGNYDEISPCCCGSTAKRAD